MLHGTKLVAWVTGCPWPVNPSIGTCKKERKKERKKEEEEEKKKKEKKKKERKWKPLQLVCNASGSSGRSGKEEYQCKDCFSLTAEEHCHKL